MLGGPEEKSMTEDEKVITNELALRISSLQKETLLAKLLHHAVCSSIPHLSHLTHTDTHTHTHTHIHKLTHTHIVAVHPPYLPC